MKHLKNSIIRAGILTALTASLASAYPVSGTLSVLGPSDFVGPFTIQNASGTSSESGYGGGFKSNLTTGLTTTTALMFCVDFSNDVSIPDTNVGVNISTLVDNSNISDTRFGSTPLTFRSITYGNTTLANQLAVDDPSAVTILNGASALQRYQMAAYLVSNYSFINNPLPTSNNYYGGAGDQKDLGIQSAIWTILDAQGENYVPPTGSQDGAIETWLINAANWLQSGDKSILSKFEIVSDSRIAGSNNPLNTGIQEFLTMAPTTVPEPSFYGALAFGLGALLWRVRRDRGNSVPTNQA